MRLALLCLLLVGCDPGLDDLEASIHPVMGSLVELTWTQDEAAIVHAEYSFDEGEWLSTPRYEVGPGSRRLLLLGAPFETEVSWRLLVDGVAAAPDATFSTGDLPAGLPLADRVVGSSEAWDADVRWLLTSLEPGEGATTDARAWTLIVDRRGRVVWATRSPASRATFQSQLSVDHAEILVDHNSWWGAFDGGGNSQVARYDIEGQLLGTWDTPGLIQPFTQTGDGSLVWGATQPGTWAGEVLTILEPGGEPRTLFDCNAFARELGQDFCGSNTTWWDPDTGHVLFSLYTLEAVIEVDMSGEPVRWFGHIPGAWAFAEEAHAFHWQHGAHFLPDGHLLLSSRVDATTEETVVREYALDEERQELVEVWSFGEGEGVWATTLGEARRLPGGHTLHNYGSTPRIREATHVGEVVWDLSWDDPCIIGHMAVVDDLYALWGDVP